MSNPLHFFRQYFPFPGFLLFYAASHFKCLSFPPLKETVKNEKNRHKNEKNRVVKSVKILTKPAFKTGEP